MAARTPAERTIQRNRVRWTGVVGLLVTLAAIGAMLGYELAASSSSSSSGTPAVVAALRSVDRGGHGDAVSSAVWPPDGQAAFVRSGEGAIHAGPNQHEAPIASVAKVMTAYLVLSEHPLRLGEGGPEITLTDLDAADTERRREQEESIVPVVAGEHLSELEALQALLLPSANNIAAVLARWAAGSEARFVARMNATARSLGMTDTHYTDPSGYDDATVSTAADQVRIVVRAMRLPVFARIVATSSAWLPVAGVVHNTDALLGHAGFVGVKTGSDAAAGGCFAFRAVPAIGGKRTTITGVVLGQPGGDRIDAGLVAADLMVARIVGRRATRDSIPASAPPRP
jgi:serine-type D-Ala-D-Ala carboxypeptidase (penicillin-binding protein 5/6)